MRLQNIELLRFLAALGVVFFHTVGGLIARGFDVGPLVSTYGVGARGVDVFFVISGFVIYRGVLETSRSPKDFLVARLTRILPSYWILTVLAIFSSLALANLNLQGSLRQPNFEWVIASLTFTSELTGNSSPILYQGWSLEYEMLFYLLLTTSLFIPNKSLVALVPAAVLSGLVFAAGMNPQMIEFVAGMAVAFLTKGQSKPLLGAFFATFGLALLFTSNFWPLESNFFDLAGQVGAASLVLGCVLLPQTKLAVAASLGSASYPVYLLQWFTIPTVLSLSATTLESTFTSTIIILVSALITTQVLGMAFDRFVDQPIRKVLTIHGR